jgi:hypothetical protein
MPTAYSPLLGSLNPSLVASRRKNLSGVATRIPAPSPLLVSQPQRPAVLHVLEDLQALLHGLVRELALEVRDEPDAARVLLELRQVEALGGREAGNLRRFLGIGHESTFGVGGRIAPRADGKHASGVGQQRRTSKGQSPRASAAGGVIGIICFASAQVALSSPRRGGWGPTGGK